MLSNKTTITVGAASAAITGLVFAATLLLTPSPTLAADECGTQIDSGNPESFNCPDASYAGGVTYTADGDLTIDFNNDATSTIGGTGITLMGDGSENITFDSNDPTTTIRSLSGMNGNLLGITTEDGNILITTSVMDADTNNAEDVDRAIFAQSTGIGSIDITTTGVVDAASTTTGANPDTSIGIEALTDSGAIGITTGSTVSGNQTAIRAASTGGDVTVTTNGNLAADEFGIQASTGGAGTLTLDVNANVTLSLAGEAVTAIDASTDTGLLDINVDANVSGREGAGIRAMTNGNAQIDVVSGTVSGNLGLDATVAGELAVTNGGILRGGTSPGEFAIQINDNSGSLVLDNNGEVDGGVDFSGLGDGYTFNNNGVWDLAMGLPSSNANPLRFSTLGIGTFNNAGTIEFGQQEAVVRAPGTTFNGLTGSVLDMEMTLSSVGQASCDAAVVAGCLDLTGGTTTGQTSILVTSAAPALDPAGGLTREANPGILLVDVSGGTSAAEHFVLHSGSENYVDTSFYGGVIGTGGPLVYSLLYNPSTQQHILSTVPTEEGAEYATFIDEAVSIWHTTADAVVGRQADLRGGATGGGWARLVSARTTRDTTLSMTTHGNSFTFDMGYEQDTRAALFGFDAMYGDNYVIGLHGGLISSETDYDGTGNGNEIEAGAAAGIYSGWWRDLGIGQLTVDATVNGNFLTLDHDASYEVTHSDIRSLGIRAEAGWKVPVIDGFYVQPLATLAYVRSDIETMELRQNNISFEDAESQRVALGVRLGGHFEAQSGLTARYWLTGRAWDERAEDGRVEYATTGEPLTIADDISGSFEEVGFGASLSNQEDTLSVFASGSTKFIDDVTNYNVTVGLRKRW